MSDEIDLYHFAKLFDAALTSDNEAVKKALRNFMLVASIAEAEEVSTATPFGDLLDRVNSLEKNMEYLKRSIDNMDSSKKYGKDYYYDQYSTTWPSTYTTGTTGTNYTSKWLDSSYDVEMLKNMLGKGKI